MSEKGLNWPVFNASISYTFYPLWGGFECFAKFFLYKREYSVDSKLANSHEFDIL